MSKFTRLVNYSTVNAGKEIHWNLQKSCNLLSTPSMQLLTRRKDCFGKIMAQQDYRHTMFPAMGSRKLAVKLQEDGYTVGWNLVRRLVQEMGIWAIYPNPYLSKQNFRESNDPYFYGERWFPFQIRSR